MEMEEEALVQDLRVPACTSEPPRNRGLSKAENSLGSGRVQPFSESRQHHGDLLRGGFQSVQRSVASGSEGGAARLTPKGLDRFSLTMLAIANERVDLIIGDPEVQQLLNGTG